VVESIGREKVIGPIKFGSICLPRKPILRAKRKNREKGRWWLIRGGGE